MSYLRCFGMSVVFECNEDELRLLRPNRFKIFVTEICSTRIDWKSKWRCTIDSDSFSRSFKMSRRNLLSSVRESCRKSGFT